MRMVGLLVGAALLIGHAPPAAAQGSRCAPCHVANLSATMGAEHVSDWQRSAHARRNVGCHECHGGNPWAYEPRDAHRGVLGPKHPASPVNRANLVNTCARCHQRNALAFADTLHATLAQIDDRRAPTCTTCHGVMSSRVPSPTTVEARCAECHPPNSPRGAYPALMRDAIEALMVEQGRAEALQDAVERLTDYSARVTLTVVMLDTRAMLQEASAAVHRLDSRGVEERTASARRRLDVVDARIDDR